MRRRIDLPAGVVNFVLAKILKLDPLGFNQCLEVAAGIRCSGGFSDVGINQLVNLRRGQPLGLSDVVEDFIPGVGKLFGQRTSWPGCVVNLCWRLGSRGVPYQELLGFCGK